MAPYRSLKKKGFLVLVFTNTTLITEKHIKFFKDYPPRDIEVTVYGITKEIYEMITRNPGSFDAFICGQRCCENMDIKGYFIKKYKNFYRGLRFKLAVIKAYWYDKLLGIDTSQQYFNESKSPKDNSFYKDMYGYQPAFYGRLEKTVAYLKLTEDDVFVDLGCGKGRVVFFVARQKVKKVIGVELNPELFAIAQKNLKNFRYKKSPIKLLNMNVTCFDPKESTIFFLFNPFGQNTLEKVLGNIKDSLAINPRKIRIIYYAAQFRQFIDSQNWLIYEGFIENDNCLVWHNKHLEEIKAVI